MRFSALFIFTFSFFSLFAQQKADTTWKVELGDATLGMILPDGKPVVYEKQFVASTRYTVRALDPATGATVWQNDIDGSVNGINYYQGTPYLEAGGYVINPLNGAKLNLGAGSRTNDGKPIQIIRNYIFPAQNVVLVYGKVKQGVTEDNVDEVFCAIDYTTGKTLWTRNDLFKNPEQKKESKGVGGFLKKVGNEMIKDNINNFEDSKYAGERFLTDPLGTKYGLIVLPLNRGIFGIEISTGNVKWKRDYAAKKNGKTTTRTGDATCVLAYNSDSTKIYVSRADFTDAMAAETGKSFWEDPMESKGPASFLHFTKYGVLSLPTKDVALMQSKRIHLFDAETGQQKWEIKNKYGVQSYIQMGDIVALDLQNAGDKESVNLLDLSKGQLQFEKNVSVEGNVMSMKAVDAGILVVTDEEICIINNKGEKTCSLEKKKDRKWIMNSNDNNLYVIVAGDARIHQFDYSNGQHSEVLSEKLDFKGNEDPSTLEWYKDGLLVSSSQNLCYVDTKQHKILYQKYYKAPGRTLAGKILSGYQALMAFSTSIACAGTSLYSGMMASASINSDAAQISYLLFPKESAEYTVGLLDNMVGSAMASGELFKTGLDCIRSMGKRFTATSIAKDNMYVMGSSEEGDFAILQVSKKTGEVLRTISLRKRDKNPDYLVDEESASLYYIPQVSFGEDLKASFRGKQVNMLRMNLQ